MSIEVNKGHELNAEASADTRANSNIEFAAEVSESDWESTSEEIESHGMVTNIQERLSSDYEVAENLYTLPHNSNSQGHSEFTPQELSNIKSSSESIIVDESNGYQRIGTNGMSIDLPTAPLEEMPTTEFPTVLRRYSNLVNRNSLLQSAVHSNRNPLTFYADVKLTPFKLENNIYQVFSSAPGIRTPNFKCKYSIVYHGKLTYSWSLLKTEAYETNTPIVRPLATLETSSKHFGNHESVITDLEYPLEAKTIKVVHFYDSWSRGGNHVGFQANDDHQYVWEPINMGGGSNQLQLYLWRTNIHDPQVQVPAARIIPQLLIQNPMEPTNNSGNPLWCLEIDLDRVSPQLALLSAFSFMNTHKKFHAWFAPKNTVIPRPMPLVNFAFQDEGRVFQRSQKFWGDWEDSRVRREDQYEELGHILLIRVFNKAYLKQFAVPRQVIDMLNMEASIKLANLKGNLAIYD